MQVLDKGEVNLINHMGGDAAVVAAARVSNGVSYEEASKGPEKDAGLINFLIKNRHGSPFEHSTFQFYIKAPIFVTREWMRHRMSSFNEISGRYVTFEPDFYIPSRIRVPAARNKQGSVFVNLFDYDVDFEKTALDTIAAASAMAYDVYTTLLERGVAKEMARIILPLNTYTEFYFTVNARSLMNFLSLRSAEDAQWEIRQYAETIMGIFKEKMPLTFVAWEGNGYLAP